MILDWPATRTQSIWKTARALPGGADIHSVPRVATLSSLGRLGFCRMRPIDKYSGRQSCILAMTVFPQSTRSFIPSILRRGATLARQSTAHANDGTSRARPNMNFLFYFILLELRKSPTFTIHDRIYLPTCLPKQRSQKRLSRSSPSLNSHLQAQSLLEKRRRRIHQTAHTQNGSSPPMN